MNGDAKELLPLVSLGLAVAIALLILFAALVAGRRRQAVVPSAAPADDIRTEGLRERTRRAADRATRDIAQRAALADAAPLPWIAVVGMVGAETSALVATLPTRIAAPSAKPELPLVATPGGVVLDLGDPVLARPNWLGGVEDRLLGIARARPDRPLDGLVVVLPAAPLLDRANAGEEARQRWGEALYQLFWAVQRTTGMRVPIHVVVSGGEAVDGLSELMAAVADPAEAQLGWSAPHQGWADVGAWLAAAETALVEKAGTASLDALMGERAGERPGALILLPDALRHLVRGLGEVLGPAGAQAAYHDPFLLQSVALVTRPGGDGPVCGVDRTFARQVFPAAPLAAPARFALGVRHQQIRRAGWALAALAILSVAGLAGLLATRSHLEPVQNLVSSLRVIAIGVSRAPDDPVVVGGAAADLIDAFGALRVNRIESWLAPTSFLTGATRRVELAVRVGYEQALLRALAKNLVQVKLPAAVAPLEALPPEPDTALGALTLAIERLETLDARSQDFIATTGDDPRADVQRLGAVASYALGLRLPPGFGIDTGIYGRALVDVRAPALGLSETSDATSRLLRNAFAGVVERRHVDAGVLGPLSRLQAITGDVMAADGATVTDRALAALGDLQRAVTTAPPWLMVGTPVLAEDLRALAERIDRLCPPMRAQGHGCLVEPGLGTALAAAAERRLADVQAATVEAAALGVRPALVADADGPRLAPGLEATKATLQAFLDDPRLGPPGRNPPADPRPAPRLAWNADALQDLNDLAEDLLLVATTDLGRVAPVLARAVQSVTTARLIARIDDLAATAARAAPPADTGGDAALYAEARNFASVGPSLRQLRSRLRQLGMEEAAFRLDVHVRPRALALLGEADAALGAARVYAPFDAALVGWEGRGTPSLAAFGAIDGFDLANLLTRWRGFVRGLAFDLARAPAAYLDGQAVGGEAALVLDRWRGIVDTLERFDRDEPGTSLEALERFVVADLNATRLEDCRLGVGGAVVGKDWFAERHRALRRVVADRCEVMRDDLALGGFEALADDFERLLAGRFPFASAAAPPGQVAEPAAVRSFFDAHGDDLGRLATLLQATPGADTRGALTFVDALERSRASLAPLLEPPFSAADLVFEVSPSFRTNAGMDRGGNQIIEWELGTPAAVVSSLGGGQKLTWQHGEPMTLRLRWARNAPLMPMRDPAAGVQVEGRTAVIRVDDPWALFRLARRFAVGDAERATLADPRPTTLKLTVPLIPNPEAADGGDADLRAAEVYLRLVAEGVVVQPEAAAVRRPVDLLSFPTAAPRLARWR